MANLDRSGVLILVILTMLAASSCAAKNSEDNPAEHSAGKAKTSRNLVDLQQDYEAFLAAGNSPEDFSDRHPGFLIVDSYILVDLVAEKPSSDLVDALKSLGAKQVSSYGRTISCFFPISSIEKLEQLGNLRSASPSVPMTTRGTMRPGEH
jgi:hypothetical protein